MSSYGAIFINVTLNDNNFFNWNTLSTFCCKKKSASDENTHKITNDILLYVFRNVIQESEY